MFGGEVNFNGIQIDPQQMMQMQQYQQICREHPDCVGCPLFTMNNANSPFICENALMRLSQGGNANESGQSDTTQQGTQETV